MVYQGNSDGDATHSNNVFLFKAALIDFWPLGGSVTICCSMQLASGSSVAKCFAVFTS